MTATDNEKKYVTQWCNSVAPHYKTTTGDTEDTDGWVIQCHNGIFSCDNISYSTARLDGTYDDRLLYNACIADPRYMNFRVQHFEVDAAGTDIRSRQTSYWNATGTTLKNTWSPKVVVDTSLQNSLAANANMYVFAMWNGDGIQIARIGQTERNSSNN